MIGINTVERLKFDIDLPPQSGESFYSKKTIEKSLIDNQSELEPFFYRLIDNGDSRLEIHSDSMTIDDIYFDLNKGYVDVSYNWGCYMGCKDLNAEGDANASFEFKISDGLLSVDIKLPPAWRPDDYMG